jgi:Fe-S-cluster containining protein
VSTGGDRPDGGVLPVPGSDLVGEGIRFECRGCGACCATDGFVFVTPEEVREMASHLGMKPKVFLRRFTYKHVGRVSLSDAESGGCCFLEDKRCLVYEVRPYQCRSFPFWLNNLRAERNWKRVMKDCPGIGRGKNHGLEEIVQWVAENPFPPAVKK